MLNYLQQLKNLLEKLSQLLFLKSKIEEETHMTYEDKFIKVCIDALDTDPTPKDEVSDDVACAQVVSTLLKKVFPDFPILPSTRDLYNKFENDKRFLRVNMQNKGRIIISPRTPSKNGHVGVWITNEKIASNNSFGVNAGKFTGNYTLEEWKREFQDKRKLKTYIYEIVI